MARIVSYWDELQKILARMEPPPSHKSPTTIKGQKNQVKVCANNIKRAFIKIKKWNTLDSNSLSPTELPLWAQAPATWEVILFSFVWEVRLGLGWTMAKGVNGVAI